MAKPNKIALPEKKTFNVLPKDVQAILDKWVLDNYADVRSLNEASLHKEFTVWYAVNYPDSPVTFSVFNTRNARRRADANAKPGAGSVVGSVETGEKPEETPEEKPTEVAAQRDRITQKVRSITIPQTLTIHRWLTENRELVSTLNADGLAAALAADVTVSEALGDINISSHIAGKWAKECGVPLATGRMSSVKLSEAETKRNNIKFAKLALEIVKIAEALGIDVNEDVRSLSSGNLELD